MGGGLGVVVPGPLGAFTGAPRSEGRSGRGSGERREVGLSPHGWRSVWAAKRRGQGEGSPKQRAERGVRPGGPRPGPGDSEGDGGGNTDGRASLRAGCTLLRPHELLNCLFLSGLSDRCSGHWPPRPRSRGEGAVFGVVAGSQFFPVDLGAASPPPPAPSTLSNPGCFGSLRVGGAGGSEHFLITSCHRFCSTRAPAAHAFSEVGPHPLGPVSVLKWPFCSPMGSVPLVS